MTARSTPTPEMRALFVKAAKRWNVPITLLLAIARVESGFDAELVAPAPSTARGMFRATDAMREAVAGYMPADASELEKQITLCAVFMSVFLDEKLWAGNRSGAVMSFYYAKAAPTPYDGPIEAGAARASQLSTGNTNAWPADARKYLDAVMLARISFAQEGKVRGDTQIAKLYYAMESLLAANGDEWAKREYGFTPPTAKFADWMPHAKEWFEWERDSPLNPFGPSADNLHALWTVYEAFFEMAPITDATTPAPWNVAPGMKAKAGVIGELVKSFGDRATWVKSTLQKLPEKLDQLGGELAAGIDSALTKAGVAAFVLLFGLGTVYILANRRQRA